MSKKMSRFFVKLRSQHFSDSFVFCEHSLANDALKMSIHRTFLKWTFLKMSKNEKSFVESINLKNCDHETIRNYNTIHILRPLPSRFPLF